jgi:hypothetical protein
MDPTSKKEGHCDIIQYVLFCLTYMYRTLYILYILYSVYIAHHVHVPYFPVSDVEVSPSISVHAQVHLSFTCVCAHASLHFN